ncbi:MAG TPA: hypothetical protein VFZ78_10120 [Flavisolibacter sp.]
MEQKCCRLCGMKLRGRSDKIFCNDYCRNTFNNQRRKTTAPEIRAVNRILLRNRDLLEHFYLAGTKRIRTSALYRAGFDPAYNTHQFTNAQGQRYTFIYDYGFVRAAGNSIVVVKELFRYEHDKMHSGE